LQINASDTVKGPLTYAWWERLLPGSFVYKLINSNIQPKLSIQNNQLKAFTDKLQQENFEPYKNATIALEGEEFAVKPEANGQDYPSEVTGTALGAQFFESQGDLLLKPNILSPKITSNNAESALTDAKIIVSALPKYSIGSLRGDIPKTTFASWLVFEPNEEERKLTINLSATEITKFLSGLYAYAYTIPAGVVNKVDNNDVTVLPGDDSNAVNIANAVEGFRAILDQKGTTQTVTISQIAVTADMRAKRDYGRSQLGLQALIQDIAREKGDYAIAVQELGGRGWSANVNGEKKYTPASTYKLFVAYAVLKNIEAGKWTWGGSIAGTSVEHCFDIMIINSDNTCAEAFGGLIGWKNIEIQVQGLGLKNTRLTPPGDFLSTANDEVLFLTKLGRGEILNQASRDKLIGVMKRQVYRQGIPTGVGVPVADKVGFLWELLHDSAIVYAPQGTYVLVILTDASSWGNIADSARRINDLLK